jgi:hypothetical protein
LYICRWLVLCETVVNDQLTQNLTMVNALTELVASSFPSLHVRFAFAARLELEGEPAGDLALRFVREAGEDGNDEVLLTVTGDSAPQRVQFYFNFPHGIRLLKSGAVVFRVEAREGEGEWYTVATQNLHVHHRETAAPIPPETDGQSGEPASRT